jgi:hypothetical protein
VRHERGNILDSCAGEFVVLYASPTVGCNSLASYWSPSFPASLDNQSSYEENAEDRSVKIFPEQDTEANI